MQIEFKAVKRVEQGTGASRRLRRAGQLPGVIYGASKDPVAITLDHNELFHLLRKEAFHASILTADVDGTKESVVLRDAQWHPFRQLVLHLDFQRISATEKMHLKVPFHFVNDQICPAVKLGGQMISHVLNEIDVACLPADLPEFIEIDLKDLEADHSIHLSDIKLPAGVEIVHHGEGDPVIVTALKVHSSATTDGEDGESSAQA